jgi:hypothetical protein
MEATPHSPPPPVRSRTNLVHSRRDSNPCTLCTSRTTAASRSAAGASNAPASPAAAMADQVASSWLLSQGAGSGTPSLFFLVFGGGER